MDVFRCRMVAFRFQRGLLCHTYMYAIYAYMWEMPKYSTYLACRCRLAKQRSIKYVWSNWIWQTRRPHRPRQLGSLPARSQASIPMHGHLTFAYLYELRYHPPYPLLISSASSPTPFTLITFFFRCSIVLSDSCREPGLIKITK